jgi:phosphatidate cytidylyltransferase
LKRVLTALALIPLVLALLLRAPQSLFAAAVGIVALLAADEFLLLAKGHGFKPFRVVTLVFIGLYFAGLALKDVTALAWKDLHWPLFGDSDILMFAVLVRVFPLLLLVMALAREDLPNALPSAAVSYLAVPYIAITLGELVNTRRAPAGIIWLLFFLIVIWCGDIFAYYVGRMLGRHPLAPVISPNKTWEGAVASFAGSIGVGLLLFENVDSIANSVLHFLFDAGILHPTSALGENVNLESPGLWQILIFLVLVNIAAQLGDLVESMMKRGADVKDSGSLLPGHGGVLDRIDALLLAAPVVWYYASIVKLTS